MKTGQKIKDKILNFLDYLFRLVMINVLIIVPSFSFIFIYSYFETVQDIWLYITLIPVLLYFIPSVVAGFACVKMYEDSGCTGIFKEFYSFFKKFYVKSLLLSLIVIAAGFLFGNSAIYFYQQISQSIINVIGFFISVSVILVMSLALIHIPLSIVYFEDLGLIDCIKTAFLIAFKNIWKTILMLISVAILILIDTTVFYFMALVGISLPIYVLVKISFRQYITIYHKL